MRERHQRVMIGKVTSRWVQINAGVTQEILLGPPCFLLHINDLWHAMQTVKYVYGSTVWEAGSTRWFPWKTSILCRPDCGMVVPNQYVPKLRQNKEDVGARGEKALHSAASDCRWD